MADALTIGFLGAGTMATALARGILGTGLVKAEDLFASDIAAESRAHFQKQTHAPLAPDNLALARAARVLIVAVKPAQVVPVLSEIGSALTPQHLVISIAAGIPLARLEQNLPAGTRVVRVMPNTPALVGAGASAFALGKTATSDDAALVERLFSAVGLAVEVKESLLDAVTGLSGSGPAYAYVMVEALSDGGVAVGLPRDIATRLAAQTLLGAARTVLETGQHPGELKDMVTSPGGTTIEGLHALESAGVRAALISAVRASADKARKLAQS
jgi:pyrroline-5-carboxylate reductase